MPDEAPQVGWRNLARPIQEEKDPRKMIELVEALIAKFDEDKMQRALHPNAEQAKAEAEKS